MYLSKIILILVITACISVQAYSATTLDSLVEETLQNNPDINSAKARWDASSSRPSQEGSLPNPMIGVSWQNVGFDSITLDEIPNSMLRFPVSQEIPFPGKLSTKENVSREESRAMGKVYDATVRSVVSQLKQTYFDWAFVVKSIEIVKRNKQLLEKFAEISKTKYEVGKGIQQDVVKAQVEVSKLMEELLFLNEKKKVIEARIIQLLNRDITAPLGEPEDLERFPVKVNMPDLMKVAEENAPMLKIKENLIERDEESLKLARKQYYPDFVVSASPGLMGRSGGGYDGIWEISLGLKVPLYFWRKEKFGVQEATMNLDASKNDFNAEKQSLFFKIREQYLSIETTEKLIDLYKNGIIPQSRLSLESAMSGYQVGDVDFLTLMDNLVTLYQFEREYYRQLAENQKSLAVLEELSGAEFNNYTDSTINKERSK